MITLHNLIELEKLNREEIINIQLWWYGKDIARDYISSDGLLKPIQSIRGASFNTLYLIMAGVDGTHCIYHFAIKLTERNEDGSYSWVRVPLALDEYSGRLVLYRATGHSFYNNILSDFTVSEIKPVDEGRTVDYFTEYENVELSFKELQEIVSNQYIDYYKPLSAVKGIYMIVDGNSGKQYIGSAYGEEALYSRWKAYALTYHGGNIELKKLLEMHGSNYFLNFKYFILRVLPKKTPDQDVIEMENYYKKRYLTREFGLNQN